MSGFRVLENVFDWCNICTLLMYTAHGFPKLSQSSTRNNGGQQSFSVSACHRKAEADCYAWIYWKLLHVLILTALITEAKLTKLLYHHLKVCSQLLSYLTEKITTKPKQAHQSSLRKKFCVSKVNLLKQLFFSRLYFPFQDDQINNRHKKCCTIACLLLLNQCAILA